MPPSAEDAGVDAVPTTAAASNAVSPAARSRAWIEIATPGESTRALCDAGYSPILAALLARRGVTDAQAARRFLDPCAEQLHDPFLLAGMEEAVATLVRARERGRAVAVVGDYDVDGVTSTALLVAVLRSAGIAAEPVLPHRLREGYGFQVQHVERARELGCGTIVTVDCGTTAIDAVGHALAQGLEVVVTDHHLPGDALPPGAVLVNPRQAEEGYPFRDLAGVGLAFKLALALLERLGRRIDLDALLRLAALGTIADLAPLHGENRVIAALGLARMRETRSVGLRALMARAGVGERLRAGDVGYKLGPRLNAAGRLASAEQALRLLLTRDAEEAARLADELDTRNRARQAEEARAVEEARAAFADLDPLPPILVAASEGWHKGVVGIAAGRIARELGRPTVLLAADGELATGSGRSVPGIALHQLIEPFRQRLERFGGHSQAIGLTVRRSQLDALRLDLEAAAASTWDPQLLAPRHEYELTLGAEQVSRELLADLERLEPFGQANPQPLARVGPLRLVGSPRHFGNDHLKGTARGPQGAIVALLGWGMGPRADELTQDFEVLAAVEHDPMRGAPVLRMVDVRQVG